MHAFFDREGDLALIVKDDGGFSGVIAIYGTSGDHYPMVVGHAAPTGYKIKGALREVNVHAGANFFCFAGFDGDLFNTVEVICSRVLGGSCGGSYFVMDEAYSGAVEFIG